MKNLFVEQLIPVSGKDIIEKLFEREHEGIF
jgi:hypothetical protein